MVKVVGISQQDIDAVREVCPRAAEVIEIINSSPEIKMYLSLSKIVDRMCDELNTISSRERTVDEKGLVSDAIIETHKDDKVFERINAMVKNFSDYVAAFKSGRDAMKDMKITEEEKKKERRNFLGNPQS